MEDLLRQLKELVKTWQHDVIQPRPDAAIPDSTLGFCKGFNDRGRECATELELLIKEAEGSMEGGK